MKKFRGYIYYTVSRAVEFKAENLESAIVILDDNVENLKWVDDNVKDELEQWSKPQVETDIMELEET